MNAYQTAYAKALALKETASEAHNDNETQFFNDRGLTRREAYGRDDIMNEYDNDPTADELLNSYFDAVYMYAEAENSLIAWGLSLVPDGLRKDVERAANHPKFRNRLVDIFMKLNTKCGDAAVKKQLATLYGG